LKTETLQQRNSDGRETFHDSPRILKVCRNPWLDVFMRALIPVEDILSIWCEMWLDKSKEFNIY